METSLSTGIIQKLYQCATKPSDSETIDDRINPAGHEHRKVSKVTKQSSAIGDTSPAGYNANGRYVTYKECDYSNEDGFGSFDIHL